MEGWAFGGRRTAEWFNWKGDAVGSGELSEQTQRQVETLSPGPRGDSVRPTPVPCPLTGEEVRTPRDLDGQH